MLRVGVLLLAFVVCSISLGAFFLVRYLMEKDRRKIDERLNDSKKDSEDTAIETTFQHGDNGWERPKENSFSRMINQSTLKLDTGQALGIMSLTAVLIGTALFLYREDILFSLFGVVCGIVGTMAVFYFFHRRYKQTLQEQLPDALYLLARSLRAGLSLDQAIKLVGDMGAKPLSEEFKHCSSRISLGMPIPTALAMMSDRLDSVDFRAFVSTVGLYQKSGGNLPLLIDRLATGTRERNQFRGHVRAATALGRTSSFCIAATVPIILLGYYLFQPDYVTAFFQSTTGWITVGVVILLEIIGTIWLFKLTNIKI